MVLVRHRARPYEVGSHGRAKPWIDEVEWHEAELWRHRRSIIEQLLQVGVERRDRRVSIHVSVLDGCSSDLKD